MENQKSTQNKLHRYQLQINKLISGLTYQNLKQFVQIGYGSLQQVFICCNNMWGGKADWDILMGKKIILETLYECFLQLDEHDIKIFNTKIKVLTFSVDNIIKDGIISLYSDLSQLRRKCLFVLPQKLGFAQLIRNTQKALEPIMRDHFMVKELGKIENKISCNSLKKILSETQIEEPSEESSTSLTYIHSIKQFLTDKAIGELSRSIENKSIKQLISLQLKTEQNEIQQGVDTCRICKEIFKLKNLQSHVSHCSKIESNRAKRSQLLEKQLELIEEMKKQMSKNGAGFGSKDEYKAYEINKIYRNIISSFDKSEQPKKRGTVSYNKKMVKRLSFQIDQFLLENGDANQLLNKFREIVHERDLLEKKLVSLESKYYIHGNKENVKSQCSVERDYHQPQSAALTKSLNILKMNSMKTKKSIFARKSGSALSNSDKDMESLVKIHSMRTHLDYVNNHSDDYEEDDDKVDKNEETSLKMHRSLDNFGLNQQKRVEGVCVDDFDVIKYLGKGAFGKVFMVRRKKTQDIYALKMIKIEPKWGDKQLQSIQNQHEILSRIAGEHLVKAPFSFTEGSAHFFVLQYMPGGDLSKIIEEQVYLSYEESQFYLAEIVLAIQRLHQFGIIHRDLKPENLVLDEKGHLKLTDFGLSQMRINDKIRKARMMNTCTDNIFQTKQNQLQLQLDLIAEQNDKKAKIKSALIQRKNNGRLIGTPDYIAPEIIKNNSLDNLSIDWWSLGVIAYEMMVGCRPFSGNSVDEIINNILGFRIQWPEIGQEDDMIKPVAADFIKKLLNQDYKTRLGVRGVSEIKDHPFFQGICWQHIKIENPPLIPIIDRKQKYENVLQISQLKMQITSAIQNQQTKSNFKLQHFVRYDILIQQTLSSASKQIDKREGRILKLKKIQENLENEGGEPEQCQKLEKRQNKEDIQRNMEEFQE